MNAVAQGQKAWKTRSRKEDLKKICVLIWGWCTKLLGVKLQGEHSCARLKSDCDAIELLESIKGTAFKFSGKKCVHQSLHEGTRKFHAGNQDKNCNVQDCCECHQATDYFVIDLGNRNKCPDLVFDIIAVKEELLACALLLGSDRKRFRKLIEDSRMNTFKERARTNVFKEMTSSRRPSPMHAPFLRIGCQVQRRCDEDQHDGWSGIHPATDNEMK